LGNDHPEGSEDMLEEGPFAVQEKVTWGGLLSGMVSMILRSTLSQRCTSNDRSRAY